MYSTSVTRLRGPFEAYDALHKVLTDLTDESGEGLIVHLARPTADGFEIIEVWESEQQQATFMQRTSQGHRAAARPCRCAAPADDGIRASRVPGVRHRQDHHVTSPVRVDDGTGRHPRRNRVTPLGDIVAIPLRGAWMGNRGICIAEPRSSPSTGAPRGSPARWSSRTGGCRSGHPATTHRSSSMTRPSHWRPVIDPARSADGRPTRRSGRPRRWPRTRRAPGTSTAPCTPTIAPGNSPSPTAPAGLDRTAGRRLRALDGATEPCPGRCARRLDRQRLRRRAEPADARPGGRDHPAQHDHRAAGRLPGADRRRRITTRGQRRPGPRTSAPPRIPESISTGIAPPTAPSPDWGPPLQAPPHPDSRRRIRATTRIRAEAASSPTAATVVNMA